MGKRLEVHAVFLAALTVSVFGQKLRLVSPLNNGVGRLEVYYNGTWGTVCDDGFGTNEAKVACRQLGRYKTGLTPRAIETFGYGGGRIWLDDVSCSGSESSLASCSHRSWGTNNCGHSEDVGIICDPSDITMKLTPGYKRGLLQVLHSGIWGTVCDDYFGQVEASVVCRALGYQGGKVINEESSIKMWLDDVECTLQNTDLKDCKHRPWGTNNCGDSEAVGVECFSFPEEATAARLVSTTNTPGEGILELYYGGQWGRVYYSGFGVEEATVACRMLGYSTIAVQARSSSNTGSESRRVIVEKVHCLGTELTLNDCIHYPWGSVTSSSRVVRIQCPNTNLQMRLNSTTPGRGRVEVLHNNVWGTVCRGSSFSSKEAQVVCKMANLPWSMASVTTSYGPGEGLIWLSNVDCTGTETSLYECSHSGWGTAPGCYHSSDVGVICRGASPRIHLEPPGSVLNVLLGQPISIKCVVDASPKVTSFRWTHSGRSYSGQTFSKTITSKSDSGTLTCTAQNMTVSTRINVWYPPKVHLEPGNDTIDVGVGDDLHVQCVVDDANPTTYTFRWSHNGDTSIGNTFHIQNVTKSDRGQVSCTADNGHMMTPGRADAAINVKYPPEIHLSTKQDVISVIAGNVVEVECVVDDANPAVVSYMWRHNGYVSYGQMFQNHVSSSDAGNLSCSVINEQGTSSVQTSIVVLQASSLIGDDDIIRKNKVVAIGTGSGGIVIIILLLLLIFYQRRRMTTAKSDDKSEENSQRPAQASRTDGARRKQNYESMERPSGGAENMYCEIEMTSRTAADRARAFDNHGYGDEEGIRQEKEPVYQNAIVRNQSFS
ncbi:scavenger receptor cysteine-rich domain-containing group B protein-like isoform X2 [Haliotis asinina]|uniref:scavenger receptor cysteine-rich domain-containing group B protein-like isoform X2 n=1 Tax=Haliotis asinina TaxID=109174 RepID=UPI003532802C